MPTTSMMRIDALKNAPDRAGRYWVTFSDGTKLGLYRQTVEDFGLYPGKELDEQEFARLGEEAGKMSAKMRAVRIVSASSVSKRDLQQRLVRKGEDPEQARAAVEWMSDVHLVDDRATAEQVENSLLKNIPDEYLAHAHHWILLHGRYVCTARNPRCGECIISDLCRAKKQGE